MTNKTNGQLSHGKLSPLPHTNGFTVSSHSTSVSSSPVQGLDDRQNLFELKLISLATELTRYRESSALELLAKNKEIAELRQKLMDLELVVTRRLGIAHNQAPPPSSKRTQISQGSAPNDVEPKDKLSDRLLVDGHKKCQEEVFRLEGDLTKVKSDLGELMVVYDDLQDRFHEIDRSWRCNLVFFGIKVDPHGMLEASDCLELKIRNIIRNKLNISREIVIQRCQRVFNGSDQKNNRPIVVNFQKWSDKEEILRKSKILKNSGIVVEEDFSRAAKSRRKELEKLIKEVKAVDPNKKCVLRYDKLIIDDHIYIFNENEKNVQRLPYTFSGNQSILDDDPNEFPLFAGMGSRHRPRTCPVISPTRSRRSVSVESILDRIPAVTPSIGGGTLEDPNAKRAIHLRGAKSTPSVHHVGLAETEGKMVPNFELAKTDSQVDNGANCIHEEDENQEGDDGDQSSDFNQADIEFSKQVRLDLEGKDPQDDNEDQMSASDLDEPNNPNKDPSYPSLESSRSTAKVKHALPEVSRTRSAKDEDSDSDESQALPLNNVINFEEWDNTGTYVLPCKSRSLNGKKKAEIGAKSTPKLKAKFRKNTEGKGNRSRGKRKGP